VSPKLPCGFKTPDRTNRSQHRHGRDHPKARQLHQVSHTLCPGLFMALLSYFLTDPLNLLFNVRPILRFQAQLKLLQR
jgi:hypothetical protein